jgi:hypothetical protein
MNYLYFGRSCDLNIGNGKTVSAVQKLMYEASILEKTVFSNIKLIGIEYTELTPYNIIEVIETDNSVVLLDELHAIIDINHKISPRCKHHVKLGTCFDISELFRQVRKRNITTLSTVQSFSDCVYRLKVVMQENIICEKYDISTGIYKKCFQDNCPKEHIHMIKQTNYRTGDYQYINPEPFYGCYDSSEIVKGWQDCEVDVHKKKM